MIISALFTMPGQPKYDANNPTMFDEGLKVRWAVVGDAYVDKALQGGPNEFSWPRQQLVSINSSIPGMIKANENRQLNTAGERYRQYQVLTESRGVC